MPAWTLQANFPGSLGLAKVIDDILPSAEQLKNLMGLIDDTTLALSKASMQVSAGAAAAVVLSDAIKKLFSDLLSIDLYGIAVHPLSVEELTAGFNKQQFVDRLFDTVADDLDPNRPNFSFDSLVTGVVILGGAQTVVNLKAFAELMRQIANDLVGSWSTFLSAVDGVFTLQPPAPAGRGGGAPPDWLRLGKWTANQFGPASAGIDAAKAFVNTTALGSFDAFITATHEVVQAQVTIAQQLLATLWTVVSNLAVLRALGQSPGLNLYTLIIPPPTAATIAEIGGGGGISKFLSEVDRAGGAPADQYVAGLVILTGSPTATVVSSAFKLLLATLGFDEDGKSS